MRILITCLTAILFLNTSYAQNSSTNSGGKVVTVQPKIMVIPYTKEGQDIRTILEQDLNKRIAITKLKESFDSRGYTTIDFVTKLKSAMASRVFASENKSDIKSEILRLSGADIYIEAEVTILKDSEGTNALVLVTGNEVSTGNSLANNTGKSKKFRTDAVIPLIEAAVEDVADDFLNVLQMKFTQIVENGRSIKIEFSIAQDSEFNLNSESGPDGFPLSDVLEIWMGEHAYKNNYNVESTSELIMVFDHVKIPLKDQSNGNNYNPNKFALEIWKYLKSIGISTKKDVQQSKILFTIK